MVFDLIIRNGLLADGLGNPLAEGEIAVREGRIAGIGPKIEGRGARILDARGLVVSPGFIDIHSHTDELILANPVAESKSSQGVTTEVSGNCGASAAPLLGETMNAEAREYLKRFDIEPRWSSLGEFLDILDKVPIGINFATLVGHGNIRAAAMGYENRKPTAEELAEMQRLASEAVEQGAIGMSTGLIYPPSVFADLDELAAVMSAAAPMGGFYATHMRNESDRLCEAVEEAIEIGRRAGAAVQISHHKATDKPNWGAVKESLALIDTRRAEGLDITADQYPYQATATGLTMFLPLWASDGGSKAILARLKDPVTNRKIQADINAEWPAESWHDVLITGVRDEALKWAEGMRVDEIAARWQVPPSEAVCRLLIEEELGVGIARFCIGEEDIRTVMRHPAVMVGSDASAKATQGLMRMGKPHPRAYGTFPRVLGRYVREEKVLPLEIALKKMTSMPADRIGARDRGRLLVGCWADITIFDPDRILDTSSFEAPHQRAAGIEYVLVNGQVLYENGDYTGNLPGRVLRRGRDLHPKVRLAG